MDGKQALKLGYETEFRVDSRAVVYTFVSLSARTPGVDWTGGAGGGEGDFSMSAEGIVICAHAWKRRIGCGVVSWC